jgi:sec-independent protein translocase protein TatC
MKLPRRLRHGEEATLVEHLDELRTRIIVSLASVIVTTAIAFAFQHRILHWLNAPLPQDRQDRITTFGVAEPFLVSFKVCLWVGLGAALPIVLWQIWSFLSPAVEERTQRVVIVAVVFATALLVAGVSFGYYVVLPKALSFLTHYNDDVFHNQLRASDYYGFVMMVLVAVGVVFELPVFILALVRIGVLTSWRLRHTRRIGYFLVAVVGVVLPGIDPVTTLLETIPLWVLYEGSIWLAVLMERYWERRATLSFDSP